VSSGHAAVTVPDLEGLSTQAASDRLLERSLRPVLTAYEDGSRGDIIGAQVPTPGASAPPDGEVLLFIGDLSSFGELAGAQPLFDGRTNDCFWSLFARRVEGGGVLDLVGADVKMLSNAFVGTFAGAPALQIQTYTCDARSGGRLAYGVMSNEVNEVQWIGPDDVITGSRPECIATPFGKRYCVFLWDHLDGSRGEAVALDSARNQIGRVPYG
jgi:hypothetical protein